MSRSEEIMKSLDEREKKLSEMSKYLTQLESQLALIFAASPDMIIFIHQDGSIIKASGAAQRVLGYDKDFMIGKSIFDFLHPDDVEKTEKLRDDLSKNEGVVYFDAHKCFVNRWKKKDGSYARLAWRFAIYDDSEDHTIGVACDVTDALCDNPFHFKLINKAMALASDGIVITDYQDENNPIIYANPAFCRNTGYAIDELIGQNCRVLQSDDKDQQALKTIREAVSNGEGCEVLLRNFKKDGSVFFNHLLTSPIIQDGKVTNYIGISRDITQLINQGVYVWDRDAPRGFGKKS
jgi:PAS domain S-box-containing protein